MDQTKKSTLQARGQNQKFMMISSGLDNTPMDVGEFVVDEFGFSFNDYYQLFRIVKNSDNAPKTWRFRNCRLDKFG